jgi:hypothetical protein
LRPTHRPVSSQNARHTEREREWVRERLSDRQLKMFTLMRLSLAECFCLPHTAWRIYPMNEKSATFHDFVDVYITVHVVSACAVNRCCELLIKRKQDIATGSLSISDCTPAAAGVRMTGSISLSNSSNTCFPASRPQRRGPCHVVHACNARFSIKWADLFYTQQKSDDSCRSASQATHDLVYCRSAITVTSIAMHFLSAASLSAA